MEKVLVDLPDELAELGLHLEVYQARDMPKKYIDQLISKSRQPHVLEHEGHEDAGGRFKDHQAYLKWSNSKKRVFYLLLHGENLAGVIWFGERHNSNIDKIYGVTFAIRLYEGFVGRGLSKPFMSVAHEGMDKYYPDQNIWLDFAVENLSARKAYESYGYQYLAEKDGRAIMGLHKNG